MTNRERWLEYTSNLTSPQNFIDWGWRYIIGASLQRRVWLPPESNPCYANSYQLLVGPAGVGKGLVITPVTQFLSFWKKKDVRKLYSNGTVTKEWKDHLEAIIEADEKMANDGMIQSSNKQNQVVEAMLFPMAADATTYEALVGAVAKSYGRVQFDYIDAQGTKQIGTYGHSSLCFSLPELASLLRKRTEDTVNYMLGLYDCPTDYVYDTKNQGKDRVRRGCLNLFAGTTPEFMQDILDARLFNQGFGSRTFLIYAEENRKTKFFLDEPTPQHKQYKLEILEHLLRLSQLYGPIRLPQETKDFLENWWNTEGKIRKNKSSKLSGYRSRLQVHIMKVAMMEHFSESTEMEIPIETFKRATEILEKEEQTMHYAVMIDEENPVSRIARKIKDFLKAVGHCNTVELLIETNSYADKKQREEALDFLLDTNQIKKQVNEQDNDETIWTLK